MKSVNKVAVLSLAAGLMCSTSAWADGMRNPPEGMQALGKIGGNIVYIDDASAVTRNPANLVDQTNASAIASVTLGYGKKEFENTLGQKVESKDNWSALPNIFAAIPLDGDFAAGIGLTTPYGRSTTFDQNSILRYSGSPYYTQLYALNVNPSLAYKISDSFSVGAGIDFLYSHLELKSTYPWSLITGTPDGESKIDANGSGLGYNAAITWKISERQQAALTYRSSTKVDYDGDVTITEKPSPDPASSSFGTEIEFPDVVAAGYGIQVTDTVRVEANVEWVHHALFEELSLDAGANAPYLSSDTIEANWNDNWTYGIGVDWAACENWVWRAGFIYLETPIPSQTMLPTIAEEDQSVVSVGFGYHKGVHHFDAAFAYGIFNGRDVSNNDNPAFNGNYDFDADLIGVSYGRDL